MKLALVFNPFKYKKHEENLRIVQKYFGLFPPLSLAWVAAIAEKAGHKVVIIDARTLGLSSRETLELLKKFKPDVMGFMLTTYMFHDTLEWIKIFKQEIAVPVLVGGYNLRVYPRESLTHKEIDFGILEHADRTLPALLRELELKDSSKRNFQKIPGLVFKKNNQIIINAPEKNINFNEFPLPARHLLPNELYAEFPTEKRNFTVMVTSLGCPYSCNFCEAGKTTYNPRTPEKVIAEIQECYDKYKVREIDIFDYGFTVDQARVKKICALLKQKKIDLIWSCRSRIDSVDPDLLLDMYAAGCRRIYFGIESGSQIILDKIGKDQNIDQIKQIINYCRKIGIKALGFFLIGATGETRQTIEQTVKFAKSLKLDYVQFSKCLAKPLTPLWQELVKKSGKDYWQEWILGSEIDRVLERPWTQLSNQEIDSLAKKAYIDYYLQPSFIFKALFQIRSFTELKRKIFACLSMVFAQEKISRSDENFYAFNENSKKSIVRAREKLALYIKRNS